MSFLSAEILSPFLDEVTGEKYRVSYPYWGYFENVRSIECVCGDKVVLAVKGGRLVLTGEDMRIGSYEGCDLLVTGKIKCVERV